MLGSYRLVTTSLKPRKGKADCNKQSCLLHEERCQVKRSTMCERARPPEMLEVLSLLLVSSDFFLLVSTVSFFYFFSPCPSL